MKLNTVFVLMAFAMHTALVVAEDSTPPPAPTEAIAVPTPATTSLASSEGLIGVEDLATNEKITIDRDGASRFMFERPRPVDPPNVKPEQRAQRLTPASTKPVMRRGLRFRADA